MTAKAVVARLSAASRRLCETGRENLWPVAALYSVLALCATLIEGPGWYVADNRFEQYFNPARSLAKMFSVWDGSRGLGGPREDVWLGTTIPPALLRGLGFSPAYSEHIFHALCLVTAGLGVVVLIRLFRRSIGPEHVIAGLIVMFGPFTASFLLPSNLYMMFALSPWLLVAFIRGVSEQRPWKWAAVFALIVLWAGNSDIPGLLYVTVQLVAVSLYLVLVERRVRWRDIVGWLARAGGLSLACSAWILVKTLSASEALDARLADTELPSASATSSSWSESLRGLGNWLSYFRDEGRLLKPQSVPYFERSWVVAATFVVPILALVALWRSTWRTRLLFGTMAIVSVVVMVGGFGSPNASPVGEGILSLLERVNVLTAFRNTYKAGGGLVIGGSVLAAVGAVQIQRWIARRSRRWAALSMATGATVLIGVALPFATAAAYHPFERVNSLPGYWSDAFEFLDELPVGGRSLIVPAVSQTEYRWGYVGDDIFDALLARPHATATGWMLSTRSGHNALETITLWAQDPNYRPGVLGPMARLLGITEIVLRNDVDWRRVNIARPSAFNGLRTDPDFERVATFGERGPNVVSPLDLSDEARLERTLAPVEVFRLRVETGLVDARLAADADTLVVSGDANAWPQLALGGMLGSDSDIVSSGAASDQQLLDALDAGASVVVTDTARRRVRTLLHHEPQLSPTLADGQELDRPVRPVFPDRPGTESVAWYRDAISISGAYIRLGGNRNDRRAALAFDEDPTTSWAVPWSGLGPTPSIDVVLRRPTPISRIVLQSMMTASGIATVAEVEIRFSDGSSLSVALDDRGRADVEFPERISDSLVVEITDINVFGTNVGLADISIGGLDLVEHIQVPVDLTSRDDPAVRKALMTAPTAFTFGRILRSVSAVRNDLRSSTFDEEVSIRRRFEVVKADQFAISGSLRLVTSTSETILAKLLDGPVSATSNRSPSASNDGHAALVLDRDLETSWVGDAVRGQELTIRIPRQSITEVRVVQPADQSTARIRQIEVEVDGHIIISVFQKAFCDLFATNTCTRTAIVPLPPGTVTDQVIVRAKRVDTVSPGIYDTGRIRIAEVSIIGEMDNSYDREALVAGGCVDLGFRIGREGGTPDIIPVRVAATIEQILDRDAVDFEGCEPFSVDAGLYLADTGAGSLFDQIALIPANGLTEAVTGGPRPAMGVPYSYMQTSSDEIRVDIDAVGPVIVTMRMSFDPRWTIESGGRTIPAQIRDGANSWIIPANGPTTLTIRYSPADSLRQALAVSLLAVTACLGLALWPRRRGQTLSVVVANAADLPRDDGSASAAMTPNWRRDATIVITASLFGIVLVGPWTTVIAIVTLALLRWLPAARSSLGMAPPVLLGLAAVWSTVGHDGEAVNINYATLRLPASGFAALAVVFAFQAIGLAASDARSATPSPIRQRRDSAGQAFARLRGSLARLRRTDVIAVALTAMTAAVIGAFSLDDTAIPAGLLANLRLGTVYSATLGHGAPALDVGPLPSMMTAWAPVPDWLMGGALAAAAVVGAAVVAMQWSVRSRLATVPIASTAAAILIATFTAGAIHSVSGLLALAATTWAVAVAGASPPTVRSGVTAGALLVASVLSQPTAIVVAVLIAVMWQRSRVPRRIQLCALFVFLLLLAPWFSFGWSARGLAFFGDMSGATTWIAGLAAAGTGLLASMAGPAQRWEKRVDRGR